MNSAERKIPFKVEISRILELLADQIYQSPLALLRENTQNAFDAIRMRMSKGDSFEPAILVTVDSESVVVVDNGIGMTAQEIETNYWYAGRSGKNTDEARAAGVVGTFGIGAMANFGVADALEVVSESARTGERTLSSVEKSDLSTDSNVISVASIESKGRPGTTIRARLASESRVSVSEARAYLHEFVEFVDVPVYFNEESLSGSIHRSVLPSEKHAWAEKRKGLDLAGVVMGDLEVLGMATGELRVVIQNITSPASPGQSGSVVLLQGRGAIRTLRSGFGLSRVATHSGYRWGGVADLPFLRPTAGREALDARSNQLLQHIISALDDQVSSIAASHSESFSNDGFLQWIVDTKGFSRCGPLEVHLRPTGQFERLEDVVKRRGIRYYSGRSESVVQTYASEDETLIVLSRRSPRRNCELGYLRSKGIREVDISPRVTREIPIAQQSFDHSALATRLARILEEDYFLAAEVRFGAISGGLSILVTDSGNPATIYVNPESSSVAPLLALYRSDFDAFGPFVKDFVRSAVFPRIAKLVPSSTREGSEAFLRHLRANREWFEYELDDKANVDEIFKELAAGTLTVVEATKRLVDSGRSVVEVSSSGAAPVSSVVRDFESGDEDTELGDTFEARPGIDRREQRTDALILTSESPVNGYCCFLSLSERVQREKGDFFLQPHTTEIVWGGRKVMFIFQHHSGHFGLYYDILCPGLVSAESGGGQYVTSTILANERTFVPVPSAIADDFMPSAGERKRLEVRCDVLYLDR